MPCFDKVIQRRGLYWIFLVFLFDVFIHRRFQKPQNDNRHNARWEQESDYSSSCSFVYVRIVVKQVIHKRISKKQSGKPAKLLWNICSTKTKINVITLNNSQIVNTIWDLTVFFLFLWYCFISIWQLISVSLCRLTDFFYKKTVLFVYSLANHTNSPMQYIWKACNIFILFKM